MKVSLYDQETEEGFPSKTGNSFDAYLSDMNM